MIRAVAWDIDGTLADTEPLHLLALQSVSDAAGVDLSDLDGDHFVGVNIHDAWSALEPRYSGRIKKSDWLGGIDEFYFQHVSQITEIPGAVDTVRSFAGKGFRQVAVSNSGRAIVDANLRALNLEAVMEFSISLDDGAAPKPDPAPYVLAVQRLKLLPAHILAVEDSVTGAMSANTAGLNVAFIGQNPPQFARYKIANLGDLANFLAPST